MTVRFMFYVILTFGKKVVFKKCLLNKYVNEYMNEYLSKRKK